MTVPVFSGRATGCWQDGQEETTGSRRLVDRSPESRVHAMQAVFAHVIGSAAPSGRWGCLVDESNWQRIESRTPSFEAVGIAPGPAQAKPQFSELVRFPSGAA